jgi:hypothetical protein
LVISAPGRERIFARTRTLLPGGLFGNGSKNLITWFSAATIALWDVIVAVLPVPVSLHLSWVLPSQCRPLAAKFGASTVGRLSGKAEMLRSLEASR